MRSLSTLALLPILLPIPIAGLTGPGCDEIAGAERLLRPGVVVLLGEVHGTEQAPEAVARLVCQAGERGLAVTVGLEIPRTEQEATDTFLASEGTTADEDRLLQSGWWQRDYQDGRSSRAMFDLVRQLRAARSHQEGLRVVLIDDPGSGPGRDRAMATLLEGEIRRRPEDLFIVLTGNLHNRLVPGRTEPMGFQLRRLSPDTEIISLRITHGAGTAWVCTPDSCGVLTLRGEEDAALGVELDPRPAGRAWTGRLHVGEITASPPARDR